MEDSYSSLASLHNLLDYDVRRFASAEVQLKHNLLEWISRVDSVKLKVVLQKYLELMQKHIQNMEGFFEEEKINYISITHPIMQAYINDTEEKLSKCINSDLKDVCLLACIQAINHFKISAYGTVASFANILKMAKYAAMFHLAEVNEKQIDDRLSQVAEHEINIKTKSSFILSK